MRESSRNAGRQWSQAELLAARSRLRGSSPCFSFLPPVSPSPRLPVFFLACLLPVGLHLPACGPTTPPRIALAKTTEVPAPVGVLIWVEALNPDVFWSLQKAGKLPNITRYLIDGGVTVRPAITSYPAMTYANNVSFVSGRFPGHHDIVSNKWFDRYSLVFQTYGTMRSYTHSDDDFHVQTIFEALHSDFTATILTPVRRGATRNYDNAMTAVAAWFFGSQDTINHLTTLRFEEISQLANRTGRWPKFVLAYYAPPDEVGHHHGLGRQYEEILVDVDTQVGNLCQSLAAAGLLDKTCITFLADHGMLPTPKHLNLADWLERMGVPTRHDAYGHDDPFEDRLEHFGSARAVVVSGGDRVSMIHLRTGEHWWQRPGEKEIEEFANRFFKIPSGKSLSELLVAQPGVGVVVVHAGPDLLRVKSSAGSASIERMRRDGKKLYRYRVESGKDPLGFSADARSATLMDGQFYEGQSWFTATLTSEHPDAVVQLMELQDSARAGDLMLFAARAWDFGNTNLSGHGGLERDELVVPWFWRGPGLAAGATVEGGRTVDVMPTMLELIGRGDRIPAGLDGSSMADRLLRKK